MDIVYVDILTEENLSIWLANIELVYWLMISSVIQKGRRWSKGGQTRIVILARGMFHFIREHEELVQHPSTLIYRLKSNIIPRYMFIQK